MNTAICDEWIARELEAHGQQSEQYRHATEVRAIAIMPSLEARQERIAGIRKRRGDVAARRIEDDLRRIWK